MRGSFRMPLGCLTPGRAEGPPLSCMWVSSGSLNLLMRVQSDEQDGGILVPLPIKLPCQAGLLPRTWSGGSSWPSELGSVTSVNLCCSLLRDCSPPYLQSRWPLLCNTFIVPLVLSGPLGIQAKRSSTSATCQAVARCTARPRTCGHTCAGTQASAPSCAAGCTAASASRAQTSSKGTSARTQVGVGQDWPGDTPAGCDSFQGPPTGQIPVLTHLLLSSGLGAAGG